MGLMSVRFETRTELTAFYLMGGVWVVLFILEIPSLGLAKTVAGSAVYWFIMTAILYKIRARMRKKDKQATERRPIELGNQLSDGHHLRLSGSTAPIPV